MTGNPQKQRGGGFRGWLRRVQRGFTLVELVAVMAILAILVAVVAPAVTDTRDASVKAQAQADAKQVNNLAAEYFGKQKGSEVRTPHTTAVGALVGYTDELNNTITADDGTNQQFISSRWPEQFITHTTASSSAYETEFGATATPVTVVDVRLLESDNKTGIQPADFLTKFTAVDFDKLGGDKLSTADRVSEVTLSCPATAPATGPCACGSGTVTVHDFLWLFEKGSSGSGLDDDIRDAAVFQLTGTRVIEDAGEVELTYKRIL